MQATSNETSGTAAPAYPIPNFVGGARTKVRPVLEADIPALARLMAEAPRGFSWEREPWTAQRLKKAFEDEKEPGLWSRNKRYFAVTTPENELVGVITEDQERLGNVDVEFHIANARADRDQLGPDALATYIEYKRSWHTTPRISACLLEGQTAERDWLLASGFRHEMRCEEAWLHLGQVIAFDIYAWIPEWVLANRAPDGIGQ